MKQTALILSILTSGLMMTAGCSSLPEFQSITTELTDYNRVYRICYDALQSRFPNLKIHVTKDEVQGDARLWNDPLVWSDAEDLYRATTFIHIQPQKIRGYTIDVLVLVEALQTEGDFKRYEWKPYSTDEEFQELMVKEIRYKLLQ